MAQEEDKLGLHKIEPSELYEGNAVYYLEKSSNDTDGYHWTSVTNPSINRSRWFHKSNTLCYTKGNPNAVPCKIDPDWRKQNILVVTKDKKSFMLPYWGGTPIELTKEEREKFGITPLNSKGETMKGELDKTGFGGKGSGGAAPWGFNLPLANLDIWGQLPDFLLWILVANGGLQGIKKLENKNIGVGGWIGIIGGIYGGNELIKRKRKAKNEK